MCSTVEYTSLSLVYKKNCRNNSNRMKEEYVLDSNILK